MSQSQFLQEQICSLQNEINMLEEAIQMIWIPSEEALEIRKGCLYDSPFNWGELDPSEEWKWPVSEGMYEYQSSAIAWRRYLCTVLNDCKDEKEHLQNLQSAKSEWTW